MSRDINRDPCPTKRHLGDEPPLPQRVQRAVHGRQMDLGVRVLDPAGEELGGDVLARLREPFDRHASGADGEPAALIS